MQETLNSKKKGDAAFRHKEFGAAIECYTQVRLYIPAIQMRPLWYSLLFFALHAMVLFVFIES